MFENERGGKEDLRREALAVARQLGDADLELVALGSARRSRNEESCLLSRPSAALTTRAC